MRYPARRPLQAAALALVALLLALLAVRVVSGDRASALAGDVARGKKPTAPPFTLHRLDGRGRIDLASLRGKVVLLNFWASWCVPCKQEAAVLEAAWQRWRRRGVVFVGVDAQDFSSDAGRFVRHHHITYPTVRDAAGSTSTTYGVTGFPETWFIDPRGKLVVEHVAGPIAGGRIDRDLGLALER
jgi:cytochrome c biogenesis protein CcmG, thiol:disulfide interchange protein DsbE